MLAENGLVISADAADRINSTILTSLQTFHDRHPLRPGMPREQLKSQLKMKSTLFDAFIHQLTANDQIEEFRAQLRVKGHQVQFTEGQRIKINRLLREFAKQPYTPPSFKQSLEAIGEDLVVALIETGELIQVGEDVLLNQKSIKRCEKLLSTTFKPTMKSHWENCGTNSKPAGNTQ